MLVIILLAIVNVLLITLITLQDISMKKERFTNDTKNKKYNKYFTIGLNKTATCSFNLLYSKNNLKSFHYSDSNSKFKPGIWDVENYDAFSDNPVFEENHYNKLYNLYPNSIFILNCRNLHKWLSSRFNHNNTDINSTTDWNRPVTVDKCKEFIKQREQWHRGILEFFKDKPKKLIIVSIDEPNWIDFISDKLDFNNKNIIKENVNTIKKYDDIIQKVIKKTFNTLNYNEYNKNSFLLIDKAETDKYLKIYDNNVIS